MTTNPRQAGFTGLELLIVIVIFGLFSWVVVGNLIGLQKESRDHQRRFEINILFIELENFYHQNGYYPTTVNSLRLTPQTAQDDINDDIYSLYDPENQSIISAPTSSQTKPDSGYSTEKPEGSQYTYSAYRCQINQEPEAEETDEQPDEPEAEEPADPVTDAAQLSQCQSFVLSSWLESDSQESAYSKNSFN